MESAGFEEIDKRSFEFKQKGYIYKTIVYLSRDPFYNVVWFEPVSDKQEHFLIHNVTYIFFAVRKKKKKKKKKRFAGRFTCYYWTKSLT